MLNEQFPEWKCPVCQQKDWIESTGVSARNKLSVETTDGCLTALSFPPEGEQSGLQICGYMMEILQKVPRETLDSSSSISIDPHGVWSIASTDSINDDDEEEDGFEFKRKRSDSVDDVIDLDRNIEHTTPEVIDLTFDSDDNGQSD
jgi:predicted Rdx family selenoprotein